MYDDILMRRPRRGESPAGGGHSTVVAEASAEEARREMDINRATPSRLRPDMLQLKQPVLAADHAEQVARMAKQVYDRGIGFDLAKVQQKLSELFTCLTASDLNARSNRPFDLLRTDLTSFESVLYALVKAGALREINVPLRSTADQFNGIGEDLDAVREILSPADYWKVRRTQPSGVKALYEFNDTFARFIFGKSLITWIQPEDGRIYRRLFASGESSEKVRLLEYWLPTSHYRVLLKNSLCSVLFWLSEEASTPPTSRELATDWFGKRSPSQEDVVLAQSVLDSFLLNLGEWQTWEKVGRAARKECPRHDLELWREDLNKRFPTIRKFYKNVAKFYFKSTLRTFEERLDEPAFRGFISQAIDRLRGCVSEVAGLTVQENSPVDGYPLVGRFRDWLLLTGKPNPKLAELIQRRLAGVFPGGYFRIDLQ